LSAPSDQTPGDSPAFSDLALSEAVLKALRDVGYETPSPIQAATIPHLLAGSDVVGQAQTGTGKTAAFALPILSKIDIRQTAPQTLVLVPTRELAIQVAEAFQRYATYMKGFHVLPVYGGQSYTPQLQSLRRGVHVVVATPGRVMDHMKRGTLDLSSLRHLVLDEADEMLRMGFIDDVEWILEQTPKERQIALFSATMPPQVRRIAQRHLREPAEVTIKSKTTTASQIRQRYWVVSGMHNKLEALTRILEAESFDAMIVFARTKIATEELAERLAARGFAVEALNGDIAQVQRERTVARLKSGQIDIVVATDVAARGLDVERVSHVVNYDVPYDPESYVHRIGRTGRAGRSGEAILFIAPRERNMLRVIERATRQQIEAMQLPSIEDVNERRVARFNEKLTAAIESGAGQVFLPLIENYQRDHDISAADIAAALASIAQGATPLLLEESRGSGSPYGSPQETFDRGEERGARGRSSWTPSERPARRERSERAERPTRSSREAFGGDVSHNTSSQRDDRGAASPWRDDHNVSRDSPAGRDDRNVSRDSSAGRDDRNVSRDAPTWRNDRDVSSRRNERDTDAADAPTAVAADRRDRKRSWAQRETSDQVAYQQRSRAQAEASTLDADSASTPDTQPKSLNRRERRALERAQREGGATALASQDEASASPYVEETATPADAALHDGGKGGRDSSEASRAEHSTSHSSDARPSDRSEKIKAREARRGDRETATESRGARRGQREETAESHGSRGERPRDASADFDSAPRRERRDGDEDVETYRIEIGHDHGVKPNNIVGAIANEVGLEGRFIGRVVIREDHSFVDLPSGMPKEIFRQLQKVRVAGQPLQISRALKTHVEKLRRERPAAAKIKGKPQRGAPRGRRK